MATIKKVIEVEVISNTGDVQKLSGSLEDVKKQVADISKAANNSVKFKMDGIDKTADDIANLSVQTEKAAESTKDLVTETKSLKQQYREAVLALNEFEQGTEGYNIAAQRAGALKDQLEENARAINANKSGADALIGGLQGAAGAFAVAQGAAGLFGKENEDIQKALLKVQSALAIVNGIEAFKDSIPNFTKIGQVVQSLPGGLVKVAAQMGLLGKAQKLAAIEAKTLSANAQTAAASETALGVSGAAAGTGVAGGMTAASAATTAFKATLISTGIGAIIVGLGAAAAYFATAFESANDKAERKAQETADLIDAQLGQIQNSYSAAASIIEGKDITGGSKKAAYERLEGEAGKYLGKVREKYAEAVKNVEDYEAEYDKILSDGNEKEIAEAEIKYAQLREKRESADAEEFKAINDKNRIVVEKEKNAFKEENKALQQQIDKKKAQGESSLALQIQLKQKELDATKNFTIQNVAEQENLNNELLALQKSLADEQRAAFEKSVGIKKSNQQALASLEVATLENQKAAALAAAQTDEERFKIEKEYYDKIRQVRIDAINTQAKLDKSLAKTATERTTIERNRQAAVLAIQTETINQTEKNTETEFKLRVDALNEEARLLQEKTKLEGASFDDRVKLQQKQNEIELANLEKQGKDTKDVIKRQAEDLLELRRELAAKQFNETTVLGNIKEEAAATQQIIDLKRNEGETLAQFAKRRADLEKKLAKDRIVDANNDLQAQLDQTIEVDGKKIKVIKEGSKEEAAIRKQIVDNNKTLSDEDLQNTIDNEEKKNDLRQKNFEQAVALANELANLANELLEIQTKKVEEEYEKQRKAKEKENEKELSNIELTGAQREELERQQALELTAIEEEKAAKLKEIQKKQADIQLAVTVANILASTAAAIAMTIAQLGGVGAITPPGAALIALMGAIGATQIGIAIAQRQAVQGLAKGGMVYGMGGPTDDMVPIMASNGEAVMTARAVTKFAPVLSAMNESVGGAPIKPRFAAGGIVTTNPGEVSVTNINDIAAITGQNAVRAYILESDVTSQSIKNQRITRNARIK